MIDMRVIALFATLLSLGSSVAQPVRPDEEAIRDTISRYVNARNEKAPDRIRDLFTKEADQLVSNGNWRHGVDQLVQGMVESSSKEQAKSSVSITGVRMVDPDVAIVDGRYRTTSLDGAIREMWTTFIVKRTTGGWRIAAIRNMKPAPSQH